MPFIICNCLLYFVFVHIDSSNTLEVNHLNWLVFYLLICIIGIDIRNLHYHRKGKVNMYNCSTHKLYISDFSNYTCNNNSMKYWFISYLKVWAIIIASCKLTWSKIRISPNSTSWHLPTGNMLENGVEFFWKLTSSFTRMKPSCHTLSSSTLISGSTFKVMNLCFNAS